ncbi:MAG: Ppx/GppA family phosphatase [Solirubrobacteraceae bacterium]|nr:Ppx/GppA family phosphatase [Solirubrobacteraceae bacterium]
MDVDRAPVRATRNGAPRRAIVDLGSNTFRLVVFAVDPRVREVPGGAWRQTAELYEPVRIGADLGADGALQPGPMGRALVAIQLFDHFCRAHDLPGERIDAVATSAIREAPNRDWILDRTRTGTRLRPRVLDHAQEAGYGHLAAVNSTTLRDGGVLDIGGGSMQLVRTRDRLADATGSWTLGAVRTTERFLAGPADAPTSQGAVDALRRHVRDTLADRPWTSDLGDRLVGVGGAVRNLAAAIQHRAGSTDLGVQGVRVEVDALTDLVAELAATPVRDRGRIAGIKPARGDVVLGAAVTIEAVLRTAGIDAIETTEFGLREGVFLDRHLAGYKDAAGAALYPDVRDAAVANLRARYDDDPAHSDHVRRIALGLHDDLAALGVHAGDRHERRLLAAAASLHDIGMAVGYDDHHKHGRYLVVTNGLPGFSPADTAVIGQAIRYHRKGNPTLKPFRPIVRDGDEERLLRIAALLRLAEGLERGHDQAVTHVGVARDGDVVSLTLHSGADGAPVARWAAEGQAAIVRRAFGVGLVVTERSAAPVR